MKENNDFDLEFFELVLVNQLLFNPENKEVIVAGLDYLEADLFKNKAIGRVFGIVKNYYTDNNALPNWTEIKTRVADEKTKKGLIDVIKKIKDMEVEYGSIELTRNLETFIKQRLLVKAVDAVIDTRGEGKMIDEQKTYAEMTRIAGITLIDDLGLEYFKEEVLDDIIARMQEKEQYLSTGYIELDRLLGGGFFQEGKCLYTFGGETNIGKSIVVANFAVNALQQNKNAVIISLEMSEYRYARRISSMLSNIEIARLSESTAKLKEFVLSFKNQQSDARLFIKEFPTKSITPKAINSYLLKLQRQRGFKPDLIVLDYHTLLKPSVAQGSRHGDLQFVTQETRALSYLWEAPIVSPLQLNRSGSGSNSAPELTTISGSWDMLSDVDCHINIWQADGDRETGILRYSIKKARDGARNEESHWKIDYNTLRLYDGDDTPVSPEMEKEDDDFVEGISDLFDD